MPVPPFLISANVLICEKILNEQDGVQSAIRLVDVVTVPRSEEGAPIPLIQAFGLVVLKSQIGHDDEHLIEVKLLNTVGEISAITEAIRQRIEGKFEGVPGGLNIGFVLNLGVKRFGTCYLCLFVDGEEVARAPFTLRPAEPADSGSNTMH